MGHITNKSETTRSIAYVDSHVSKDLAFPLSFLGIGLISTWTELSFINPPGIIFDGMPSYAFLLFDTSTIFSAAIIAIATQIVPEFFPILKHRRVVLMTALLLLISTCINYGSIAAGYPRSLFMAASSIIGGVGLSLLFIMWWELLGCMSPVRMIFCYSIALIMRISLIWVIRALPFDRLWVCVCVVSTVSVFCLWHARGTLSQNDLPQSPSQIYSFPVKPILVTVLCSFAVGLIPQLIHNIYGVNGNPGGLIVAVIICFAVLRKGENFEFKLLWELSLFCMVLAIVPFGFLGGNLIQIAGVFASASYETCLMLIYVILVNLVYRYSISATWLFSIELIATLVAAHAGSYSGQMFMEWWPWDESLALLIGGGISVTIFFVGITMTFSSHNLDDRWGIIIRTPIAKDFELAREKSRLGIRCHEIAQEGGLTKKEEEILLLLFRQYRPETIADELCVEVSTVRTHIKHIHTKLDVHSRKELMALIDADESR